MWMKYSTMKDFEQNCLVFQLVYYAVQSCYSNSG